MRSLDSQISQCKANLRLLETKMAQKNFSLDNIDEKDKEKVQEIKDFRNDDTNWVFNGFSKKYQQRYEVGLRWNINYEEPEVVLVSFNADKDSFLELVVNSLGDYDRIDIGYSLVKEQEELKPLFDKCNKLHKEFWEIHSRFPFLDVYDIFGKD